MRIRHYRQWLGIVALGGALLLLACGEEPAPPPEVARPIKIIEIGGAGKAGRQEYPGTIAAAQRAELAFEVPGKLTSFPVEEGQDVAKDTVIATLDPRDYDARLDKVQARVNNSKVEYERARSLFEEGVLAKSEKDRRQRDFEVSQADLREARKAVEDTTLRAPFAGTVARKLVEDFENVRAKQSVVIFEDASNLEIKIDVPERDVLSGSPSRSKEEITRLIQPRVALTAQPDRSFDARVKEFSTTADPSTRTFRATLAFDRPDDVQILPGMTAKVSITARSSRQEGEGMQIPASAVVADASGASFVWVVDPENMSVKKRPVEVGELRGDRVAILSGLANGDWLAASGVHLLHGGMTVSRLAD